MNCPFCKSEETRIIDTRKYETVVIRMRFCGSCMKGFQTEETPSKWEVVETVIPAQIPK
jgi:transcriptional regulator NrdR family protein